MPLQIDVLPQELFDLIFEDLVALERGETPRKASLLASSLVSKAWAQHTFRHRFRSLVLYVPCEHARSTEEVRDIHTLLGQEGFLGMMLSVCDLELRFGTRGKPANITADLHHFVSHFPRLQSLHLVGYIRQGPSPPVHVATIPHMQRLKITVCPHEVAGVFSPDLCDALSQFSTIGELHVVDLWGWVREPDAPRFDISHVSLPRVTSLVVEQSRLGALVHVMRRVATERMRTLDLISDCHRLHRALELPESLPHPPEHLFVLASCWDLGADDADRALHTERITRVLGKRITIVMCIGSEKLCMRHAHPRTRSIWARLEFFLSVAEATARLEYVEVVLAPTAFGPEVLTLSVVSDMLAEDDTLIRRCEDILLRMTRAERLGSVYVRICSAPPGPYKVMRESFLPESKITEGLFPRLHNLHLLRS
ncbi:hypothetical protein PsYK624_060030 [Phanerochaete sordida]|uniref:F-box domain-containing protein n=1 Tax=Phanerochaete sordida TaxID=48140 RepID=A0A9P3LBW3_9APHY|nr:hypothetical protein PsYK624_060030 [Phanerochaete sordida]